jgi:hypothetical protein
MLFLYELDEGCRSSVIVSLLLLFLSPGLYYDTLPQLDSKTIDQRYVRVSKRCSFRENSRPEIAGRTVFVVIQSETRLETP